MLVHSKWDGSNLRLVPRAGWTLTLGLLSLCLTLSVASAQAPLQLAPPSLKPYAPVNGVGSSGAPGPSASAGENGAAVLPPRVAGKATISATTLDRSTDGATYVALASGLQSVFSGREPSTLQELKALELQQSRVAQAIERVTVNVQQGSAQGSGVIITADGYVLTAAHVAGDKDRDAVVILNDGTRLAARTLGLNRDKDAGLLKIKESSLGPLPYATIGRSSDLQVGQWCIASGHPGGWKPERGAVIRVGRVLKLSKGKADREAHTLFSDCALIGGDSGGPLFTLEGRLIGIHSRIGTDVEDNMHVPIDVFAASWDRMVNREVWGMLPGYQPVIGVEGTREGARPEIAKVVPNGPAHKAGLQAGDVILSCDGVAITTFDELRHYVERTMPGDVIVVKLRRGEQILQLPITVGVRER